MRQSPRASHAHLQWIESGAFTISFANCAGAPGVENMLGHAPPPLTASGLDMRGGHPDDDRSTSQAGFSRPGAYRRDNRLCGFPVSNKAQGNTSALGPYPPHC
jgi:hypothetical protein